MIILYPSIFFRQNYSFDYEFTKKQHIDIPISPIFSWKARLG